MRCITEHGLDSSAIGLEITEDSIMKNKQVGAAILEKLRLKNIALALDDFGTGYSSLSHLQELPISMVKIDRRFINSMSRYGRAYAATVQAIIVLAHNRNLSVVAEGIENTDQLFQLQSLECDFAQGFLFARPMPADEVANQYLAIDWHATVQDLLDPRKSA
jgi:EAL domain-containing protein (putative c-di-GMP-specific phosphodiesterase class I)